MGVLATVLRAAFTPNMSLKDILFRIAGRILNHCVLMYPKHSSSSQKHWRWMTSAKAFLSTAREHRLVRVFTSRYRKEREQSVLCSPYLHSLTALLVSCAEIRALIRGDDNDIEYKAITSVKTGVVVVNNTTKKKETNNDSSPALEEKSDEEEAEKDNSHWHDTMNSLNVLIFQISYPHLLNQFCNSHKIREFLNARGHLQRNIGPSQGQG